MGTITNQKQPPGGVCPSRTNLGPTHGSSGSCPEA
jgi:hypothetical protein